MINNKYFSFASFTIFGIKAAENQTGEINITVDNKKVTIDHLGVSKTGNEGDILLNCSDAIYNKFPLYNKEDYFVSELKIGDTVVDITNRSAIKIEKDQKADIVLTKKLKLKEIKFTDPNFKLQLTRFFEGEIGDFVSECFTKKYKDIFEAIEKITDLFQADKFGIKIGDKEHKDGAKYNADDVLQDEDVIIILDEKKIKKEAFSKFIIEADECVSNGVLTNLSNIDTSMTVDQAFNYLNSTDCSKPGNKFTIFIDDTNKSFTSDSTEKFPACTNYYKIKISSENLQKEGVHSTLEVQMNKKGCKLPDDNILKNIERWLYKVNKPYTVTEIINDLKMSYFIDNNIDKNKISIKNKDTNDNKEYREETGELPLRLILDLSPEAFDKNKVVIKLVFSLKDVQKDGRKLKDDFKNKFSNEEALFLTYGDPKSVLLNLIKGIIPGITEGDIKLNENALPDQIKEGGVISIPAEKIPDSEFEPKSKPKSEEQSNTDNSNNTGDGDKNKNEKGCCRSNK